MSFELLLAVVAGVLYLGVAILAVAQAANPDLHQARAITVIAAISGTCLAVVLVLRGIRIERFPAFGGFEASAWYTLSITAGYLYVAIRHTTLRTVSGLLLPYVALIVFLGLRGVNTAPSSDLRLSSPLLILHVIAAFAGYGLFTMESVLATAYLVQDNRLKKKQLGKMARCLPALEALDRVMAELIGPAFLLFTLSIGMGVCLAHSNHWGIQWASDPKVFMTVATWVVYAVLFHLHRGADRHGRRVALVAVFGFVCVLVAFLGVHLVADSLHDFGLHISSPGSR